MRFYVEAIGQNGVAFCGMSRGQTVLHSRRAVALWVPPPAPDVAAWRILSPPEGRPYAPCRLVRTVLAPSKPESST